MRYELTDHEWAAIKPTVEHKPRGIPRTAVSTVNGTIPRWADHKIQISGTVAFL
jgi:hypothetical protein